MNSTRPTIVLIPGSFCSAALQWDAVIDELHKAGYDAQAVELQSVSPPSTAPPKTMADDASHVHGVIEALCNEGKDVVVVMSSYGGIPGTQAIKGVTEKERKGQGKTGGVTKLVYVASLLINEGQNSEDSFSAFPLARDYIKASGEYLYIDPVAAAGVMLREWPREKAEAWARKMPGHSIAALDERMTSTSHHDVPVVYVKCTSDEVVVPAHQQKMIDDFKSTSNSSVSVVEMASGHCPMLVQPEKTTEIIINAAGDGTVPGRS